MAERDDEATEDTAASPRSQRTGRPVIVSDGLLHVGEIEAPPVMFRCRICDAEVPLDAVSVASSGRDVHVDTDAEVASVHEVLIAELDATTRYFDDLRIVECSARLSPSVAPVRCPGCGASWLAVASFGEVQPARWRLVAEGLVSVPEPLEPAEPPDLPAEPPDLPARVSTPERWWERFVVVVALVAPVVFLGWLHLGVAREWRESRSLAASGVVAMAQVVERAGSSVPGNADRYVITYRFALDGRDYGRSADVDRATYEASSEGGAIEIRYDAANPERSAVARNDRVSTLLALVLLVDVAVVGVVLLIVRSARRDVRRSATVVRRAVG